jgi:hypothetical protein
MPSEWDDRFTIDLGITRLRRLKESGQDSCAKEYIRKAPPQTDTPLRRCAREEFGWTDADIWDSDSPPGTLRLKDNPLP